MNTEATSNWPIRWTALALGLVVGGGGLAVSRFVGAATSAWAAGSAPAPSASIAASASIFPKPDPCFLQAGQVEMTQKSLNLTQTEEATETNPARKKNLEQMAATTSAQLKGFQAELARCKATAK
jgi:hypothetical protein